MSGGQQLLDPMELLLCRQVTLDEDTRGIDCRSAVVVRDGNDDKQEEQQASKADIFKNGKSALPRAV